MGCFNEGGDCLSHLFEHNGASGRGYSQPDPISSVDDLQIPSTLIRAKLPRWPRISEPEMVRHYTWLSYRNFGIDT